MKRGDIVRKVTKVEVGEVLYSGISSEGEAKQFMLGDGFKKFYPGAGVPLFEFLDGKVIAKSEFAHYQDYKVSWVHEGEASLQSINEPQAYIMADPKDTNFFVVKESVSDFQSQVANMSDEELAASVASLRNERLVVELPAEKKVKVAKGRAPKGEIVDEQTAQLLKLLSTMSEDEQKALKAKLGITI